MDEFIYDAVVLDDNKKNNLTKSKGFVERKELAKYLDKEVINYRLSQIKNPKHRILCFFLWGSGLRVGECINLTRRDLDFDNKMMLIKWQKSRKYTHRNIPMHDRLVDIMRLFSAGINMDARVFPYSRQRVFQIVKKCMGVSPHQMRHSFAVNFLRQYGNIVILSQILGHSHIQTTMEYLKIVPVDQAKELEKIDL